MNFFTRKGAGMLVDKLNKTHKKFKDEDWEKLYKNNKEFYGWLHKRVREFEEKNGIF